ncbi:MAG: ATP-binding protein [Mariprofundales bacterium]|nr:ATP-binding protein [Mariprofundales bacterium]
MSSSASCPIADIPLPLFRLDRQGAICDCNMLAEEDLSCSLHSLRWRRFATLFGPESAIASLLERALAAELLSDTAITRLDSGSPYTIHAGPDGEGVLFIVVPEALRSEVQMLQRRYTMADAAARIALELAHEVKNPLASLRGATQWMMEQVDHPLVNETATHLLHEVDRIRERIDAFLQLAPRADISMGEVNIHRLIADICYPLPSGVNLSLVLDPSLPDIVAHAARLRQALENLWRNALEAHATNIEIETRIATACALPRYTGAILQLSITSDGDPIPDEIRQHLFEPYVSSKSSGSGLGLAIVQRVVLEHGGNIRLHTEYSRVRFTLHLPVLRRMDQGGAAS